MAILFSKVARLLNHVRIYGSNVAKGFSVFQRRCCYPTVAISANGYFCHSMCLSICPSVHSERHYGCNSSRISAINLKFGGMMHSFGWWSRLQFKMAILDQFLHISWNFEIFHDRSEGWCHRSNSLKISAIGLKFDGIMHSSMKQIALKWPCSANFCKFQIRSEGWHCRSNSLRISAIGVKFGGMMHSTGWWSRLLFKMATLSKCSHFLISAGRSLNILFKTDMVQCMK